MEKKEISMIMESAKNQYGRGALAAYIGVNPVQVNNVIQGQAALPFPAALRLAELLQADPLTITCANAALKENNPERKTYLESKILPMEISRIIFAMSTKRIRDYNNHEFVSSSRECLQGGKKEVLQGAEQRVERRSPDPRNVNYFNRPWYTRQ